MSRKTVKQDVSVWVSQRIGALLFGAFLLSACDASLVQQPQTSEEIMDTATYVSVPTSGIWVNAPGAVTALERGLLNAREQRVALPNRTTVPGDNTLILLARYLPGPTLGRFRYEEFLQQVGGLPDPFQAMSSGDLLSGEDALGPYFWSEKRYGANVICVLGLRRLGGGVRQMPDNANALDVMLRNCVNGTAEDALMPISAANIANYQGSATVMTNSPIRMLSALAGPTP
ncbi:MAG: hypothetical protein ABI832_06825 [bacterium]